MHGNDDRSSPQSPVRNAGWLVLVGPDELVAGALRSGLRGALREGGPRSEAGGQVGCGGWYKHRSTW